MSNKPNLMGGSGSSNAMNERGGGSNRPLDIFEPGVKSVYLKSKEALNGVILPSFDWSMSEADTEFLKSYIPYRDLDSGEIDKGTGTPAYTAWFTQLEVQKFVGKQKVSYVSPRTLKKMGVTGIDSEDPLAECFFFVNNKVKALKAEKASDSEIAKWKKLIYTEALKDYKMFHAPRSAAYLNVYAYDNYDSTWKVMALELGITALNHLKEVLAIQTPRSVTPRDPQFEDYLLGDVTNPKAAVKFTSCLGVPISGDKDTNLIRFSSSHKERDLQGVETMVVGEEILTKRHKLGGPNSVFKFHTYQEIVDFMLDDGGFDLDIVREVCADKANLGTTERLGQPEREQDQYNQDIPMDEPTPDRKFWTVVDGQTVEKTEKELQKLVDDGKAGATMLVGESAWQTAGHYGIKKTEVAPPPPAPPAPPTPPAPPAPPETPTPPPTPEPPVKEAPTETPEVPPAPAGPVPADQANTGPSALTEEEQKELDELKEKIGEEGSIPPDGMMRLATLLKKVQN